MTSPHKIVITFNPDEEELITRIKDYVTKNHGTVKAQSHVLKGIISKALTSEGY